MNIALAQVDTTAGDIRGNAKRVRAAYREAASRGADLVVCPELALAGYPAGDLLEQRDFVAANLRALSDLAKEVREAGLIVGYVDVNPAATGKPLFNAAAVLHRRKIAAKRFKTLLPTYDVFDEARYFEPAKENRPLAFQGIRIGLSICEDIWNDAGFWTKRLYPIDPVERQIKAGAEILINISASPFHAGEAAERVKMLRNYARRGFPLFYCNLVGGNDELIFDGNSVALDSKGRLIGHAGAFQEGVAIVDLDRPKPLPPMRRPDETEEIYRGLLLGLQDYARKCGFADVLVGLSGGIDSALVCALAAAALGSEHVTGVSMPSMYSSPGSVTDAEQLAANLGVKLTRVPITDMYSSYVDSLADAFAGAEPGLAEQNIQARIRGNLLMALSNQRGALVLSTGNKSELSVGYCTLYGDMSGGLAVIADLPKTTVYRLARWINRDAEIIPAASIAKPPSAELKPDQKDQDDLPPYEVLDDIMRAYIEEGKDAAAIAKRGHPRGLVDDILRRIDRNEYKRRQAAPCLRITSKAFGIGRRMPIARGTWR